MKKILWPLLLGIVAFVVFALVTLPASVVASRLESRGVIMNGVTGTVWKGTAQVVQVGPNSLGAVEWNTHAFPLLSGHVVADVKLTRSDGFAQSTLAATPSGHVTLSNLTASVPLAALPPTIAPRGWVGKLNIKLALLELANSWPANATGTIEVLDLVGPANRPVALGSYKLAFPENAQPGGVLRGALTDIGGPLQLAGTLELKEANRSYAITGLVATRPDASADLTNSLQFLDAPDAQGRRRLALDGTM